MSKVITMLLMGLLSLMPAVTAVAGERPGVSSKYKGLKVSPPPAAGTWAILDRDGANRLVPKYLSSLGQGESGTGVIVSPSFRVEVDAIRFTLCGHDGQGGGAKKNFIALREAKTGKTLHQTMAPGNDAMQARSWDVAALRGREVRIEVHDGDPGGAFAWLGIGRIDAGPPLRVEFNDRIPDGWTVRARPAEIRTEVLAGGVPFLRHPSQHTMVPASGALEIPCGFEAERLFLLGCTVPGGKPRETYGWIEIMYRDGPPDRFPLLLGFTLENYGKQLSRSKALYLHRSADPFQHYLVLAPRRAAIERIVLRRDPKGDLVPRITAVTCQTTASGERLIALPEGPADADEEAWIRDHGIRSNFPDMVEIGKEIRRAHKLPSP
jgi:hypothetical protein